MLLGSRLDTYPPFPMRRSGALYPSALRRKTIQLSNDVLDSSDRLPRMLSARRFHATFKLPFCDSGSLVRIETGIEIPLVIALVLDPGCSLRCRQVSPILLETLIRSGLDHLPLFSRLVSVGYLWFAFDACALRSSALSCQRFSCR